MARTNLDSTAIHTLSRTAGTDITAITGDTIATGAGNGFEVPYKASNVLVLRNGTANLATVTIKTVNPAQAAAVNVTTPDKPLSVAAGDTLLFPLSAIFRQAGEEVYLDCDEAIEVAVISL